ncbi:hypothetical protein VN12_09095 [Pirellula sp. SH-Sr6A]|uniref:hypothetical protein n=1 Tax=Pirellula sp. SH-Sr6A TaxID=1632865 RepID=UPI00078BC9F0|nr:hypothetical protein [Pirellula sp. SH-Sr6A]AMV32266.1 hypothetical protein VN12_09095 [Pirellula sp. SH-Sr6A]
MSEDEDHRIPQRPVLQQFQFRISQVLLWTAAVAAFAACYKNYPTAFYIAIALCILSLPLVPFGFMLAILLFSPEEGKQLKVSPKLLQKVSLAWLLGVLLITATCVLIIEGMFRMQ